MFISLKKPLLTAALLSTTFLAPAFISGCTTNPATGDSQFTALMPATQEASIGASEHQKIEQQYGLYQNQEVVNYVRNIGAKVAANTERKDVQYKFFVLDSPIVNAFALPGGYVYVSRGILTLANNEAELAAVLAHEIGHVTGRHSAERYSTSVLTSLGAAVISAAVDSSGVSQALGVGSNLYLSSYSRGQENEADTLGVRYLSRAGYDVRAMSSFLNSMQREQALQSNIQGKQQSSGVNYFSTHPATTERVSKTVSEAETYGQGGTLNREGYLNRIDGIIYGDSPEQGFVRGQSFYHPQMGFSFSVPQGYDIQNQPSAVIASSRNGGAIIFDMVGNAGISDPSAFMQNAWLKGAPIQNLESININGMQAAAATMLGQVNGRDTTIQVIAIKWNDKTFARYQIALPPNVTQAELNALKSTTYSFRRLTNSEKTSLKPPKLKIVTAKSGDTVASLASQMAFSDFKEDRFRVLNGLNPNQSIQAGQVYKIVQD